MVRPLMRRFLQAPSAILLLVCGSSACRAQSITAAMRADDRRLETRVTLRTGRMRIGQLIEELARQTSVTMTMDDTTVASGILVAASLKQTPLGTIMNGIASVAGCKKYGWEWKQTAVPGGFTYRLYAPRMELAARAWRGRSQDALERQSEFLIRAATATESERDKLLQTTGDPTYKSLGADRRIIARNRVLAEALTPDRRAAVLRGQERASVPIASLSQQSQNFIHAEVEFSKRPDLLSDNATIYALRQESEPSPTLYIDWGLGGSGAAGGIPLENQLADEMEAAWNGPGDGHDDPALARSLAPPASGPEQGQPASEDSQPAQVVRAADAAGVPVLCIVPHTQTDLPSPYGQTLGQYLRAIRGPYSHRVMSKWRDHVLLAAPVSWLLQADDYAPWQPVRQLRDALRPTGTGPDLKLLARLTVPLDSTQIQRYQKEFPDLAMAHRLRAGFLLLNAFPRIETQGEPVPITPPMREILQQEHILTDSALAFMTGVRMYRVMSSGPTPHCIEVRFELSHGRRATHWRYTYPEHEAPAR